MPERSFPSRRRRMDEPGWMRRGVISRWRMRMSDDEKAKRKKCLSEGRYTWNTFMTVCILHHACMVLIWHRHRAHGAFCIARRLTTLRCAKFNLSLLVSGKTAQHSTAQHSIATWLPLTYCFNSLEVLEWWLPPAFVPCRLVFCAWVSEWMNEEILLWKPT